MVEDMQMATNTKIKRKGSSMCFTTNGDLGYNQRIMYEKIKEIRIAQAGCHWEALQQIQNNQKILEDKLNKILEQLTHQKETVKNE